MLDRENLFKNSEKYRKKEQRIGRKQAEKKA